MKAVSPTHAQKFSFKAIAISISLLKHSAPLLQMAILDLTLPNLLWDHNTYNSAAKCHEDQSKSMFLAWPEAELN